MDGAAAVLARPQARRATFAPDGLYLSAIEYPEAFGLDELDGGALLLSPFTQTWG